MKRWTNLVTMITLVAFVSMMLGCGTTGSAIKKDQSQVTPQQLNSKPDAKPAPKPAAKPVALAPIRANDAQIPANLMPQSQYYVNQNNTNVTVERVAATPWYKHWAFWTVVGVVAAGAVTLGVLGGTGNLTTHSDNTDVSYGPDRWVPSNP